MLTTGPHDRAAAREDVRARVPCRAEACVRACVRAREAVALRPVRCWRILRGLGVATHGGARGFSGGGGVYWLRGVGVSVWRVGVACVVCAVWHACALKWRVSCSLCVFSFRFEKSQPL